MNHPKLVFFVFYKTKEGQWRGFCSPYDVTCVADSKSEAKNKLEKLVELYEKGLKKYNYPKHLTVKKLSDDSDRKIFESVLGSLLDDFKRKMKEKYYEYQSSREKEVVKLHNFSGTAEYYQPCYN